MHRKRKMDYSFGRYFSDVQILFSVAVAVALEFGKCKMTEHYEHAMYVSVALVEFSAKNAILSAEENRMSNLFQNCTVMRLKTFV